MFYSPKTVPKIQVIFHMTIHSLGKIPASLRSRPFSGLILILSLFLVAGCEGGNNNVTEPPDNSPDYVSDNWYLKDQIPEAEKNAPDLEGPQTTRDFVNYIHENGTQEEREGLLTLEAEFTQKVLDLVQAIRKRKNNSSSSKDGPPAG